MVRTPTQKELAAFVVGHGIVDFVSVVKRSLGNIKITVRKP
jgi:hypothetical protein